MAGIASASTDVTFGLQLPATDALGTGRFEVREVATTAEQLGFDSVWVGDHLAFNAPVLDAVVTATAAVAVTSRLEVGFGVMVAPLRQPAWVAKQISSIQVLSGGRVQLGLGVGGEFSGEWDAVGVPVTERGRRLDALLDALPQLLGGAAVTLAAPYDLTVPALEPHGPLPRIWVGGRSDAALRRVVRHGAGWLGVWLNQARLQTARERLVDLSAGREVPIAVQVLVEPNPDAAVGRKNMVRYLDGIYRMPFERVEPYACFGPPEETAERLAGLIAAGATTVVLMPASPDVVADVPALAAIVDRVRDLRGLARSAATT